MARKKEKDNKNNVQKEKLKNKNSQSKKKLSNQLIAENLVELFADKTPKEENILDKVAEKKQGVEEKLSNQLIAENLVELFPNKTPKEENILDKVPEKQQGDKKKLSNQLIAENLIELFADKTPKEENTLDKIGKKEHGIEGGYVASPNEHYYWGKLSNENISGKKNNAKYMIKNITDDNKIVASSDSRQIVEFLTSPIFELLLPSRAPKEHLVNYKSGALDMRSKYIGGIAGTVSDFLNEIDDICDYKATHHLTENNKKKSKQNFKKIEEKTNKIKEKYKKIKKKYSKCNFATNIINGITNGGDARELLGKNLKGFEKVIAAAVMLGDGDYNEGNLVIFDDGSTGKIDHGVSLGANYKYAHEFIQSVSALVNYTKLDLGKYIENAKFMIEVLSYYFIKEAAPYYFRENIQEKDEFYSKIENRVSAGEALIAPRLFHLYESGIDISKFRLSDNYIFKNGKPKIHEKNIYKKKFEGIIYDEKKKNLISHIIKLIDAEEETKNKEDKTKNIKNEIKTSKEKLMKIDSQDISKKEKRVLKENELIKGLDILESKLLKENELLKWKKKSSKDPDGKQFYNLIDQILIKRLNYDEIGRYITNWIANNIEDQKRVIKELEIMQNYTREEVTYIPKTVTKNEKQDQNMLNEMNYINKNWNDVTSNKFLINSKKKLTIDEKEKFLIDPMLYAFHQNYKIKIFDESKAKYIVVDPVSYAKKFEYFNYERIDALLKEFYASKASSYSESEINTWKKVIECCNQDVRDKFAKRKSEDKSLLSIIKDIINNNVKFSPLNEIESNNIKEFIKEKKDIKNKLQNDNLKNNKAQDNSLNIEDETIKSTELFNVDSPSASSKKKNFNIDQDSNMQENDSTQATKLFKVDSPSASSKKKNFNIDQDSNMQENDSIGAEELFNVDSPSASSKKKSFNIDQDSNMQENDSTEASKLFKVDSPSSSSKKKSFNIDQDSNMQENDSIGADELFNVDSQKIIGTKKDVQLDNKKKVNKLSRREILLNKRENKLPAKFNKIHKNSKINQNSDKIIEDFLSNINLGVLTRNQKNNIKKQLEENNNQIKKQNNGLDIDNSYKDEQITLNKSSNIDYENSSDDRTNVKINNKKKANKLGKNEKFLMKRGELPKKKNKLPNSRITNALNADGIDNKMSKIAKDIKIGKGVTKYFIDIGDDSKSNSRVITRAQYKNLKEKIVK